MGAAMGRETDAVAFFAALAEAPYRYDFYQTLRRLECLYDEKPRWGQALRPVDEPVRLGQDPDLSFAPAPLASFEAKDGAPPRLQVQAVWPVRPQRSAAASHHGIRAGAVASTPVIQRSAGSSTSSTIDSSRCSTGRGHRRSRTSIAIVRTQIGSRCTWDRSWVSQPPAARERDALPDLAKLFHVGALIRQVRNSEGLTHILQHFFTVPVRIEEFVGGWMNLDVPERTSLTGNVAGLGSGAVLGSRVWDLQHKFRIQLGPLTLQQYESFLPAALRSESSWTGCGSISVSNSTGMCVWC